MPDPDRLLHTLRQASLSFRDTPGRRGRLVHLEGQEVLVAGDLHGNVENFRRLLKRADLGNHPGRHLVVQELIHGPFRYPSGGDRSHQLLDLIAALKCQYPRQVHFLLGNHELAQRMQRRITKADEDLNALFREGVATAYGPRAGEIYAQYLELFDALPVALRTPNRVFLSHSLPPLAQLPGLDFTALEQDQPTPEELVPGGVTYALLWGRDLRPETATAFLEKVDADLLITGHIPCNGGFHAPNDRQLILDCLGEPAACCFFSMERPLSHAELLTCVYIL
jgi:hypothetical protein